MLIPAPCSTLFHGRVRHKKSIRGGLGHSKKVPQALIDSCTLFCDNAIADRNEILADLREERNLADGCEQIGTRRYNKLHFYLRQDDGIPGLTSPKAPTGPAGQLEAVEAWRDGGEEGPEPAGLAAVVTWEAKRTKAALRRIGRAWGKRADQYPQEARMADREGLTWEEANAVSWYENEEGEMTDDSNGELVTWADHWGEESDSDAEDSDASDSDESDYSDLDSDSSDEEDAGDEQADGGGDAGDENDDDGGYIGTDEEDLSADVSDE